MLHRLVTGQRTIDEVESIFAHLRVLLNTHRGESVTVPAFGVSDFTDLVHTLPEGIRTLEDSIRRTVQMHEPRLVHVRVHHCAGPDPLVLYFRITARLASGDPRAVHVETRLDPTGRFHVSAWG